MLQVNKCEAEASKSVSTLKKPKKSEPISNKPKVIVWFVGDVWYVFLLFGLWFVYLHFSLSLAPYEGLYAL